MSTMSAYFPPSLKNDLRKCKQKDGRHTLQNLWAGEVKQPPKRGLFHPCMMLSKKWCLRLEISEKFSVAGDHTYTVRETPWEAKRH